MGSSRGNMIKINISNDTVDDLFSNLFKIIYHFARVLFAHKVVSEKEVRIFLLHLQSILYLHHSTGYKSIVLIALRTNKHSSQMPLFGTTTAAITAIFSGSIYVLRRRISRNWIDLRQKEYPALNGKTILITGGNVGIGFETAKELARRNSNVILACRNTAKGDEAVASISKATGNDNVSCMKLDLASLTSVNEFISEIQSKYESIDVLICNAGVWIPMEQKMKTSDGYEMHFGVNHLAHVAIAKSLIPQLDKSKDGRIVFVSSGLMERGKIDYENSVYEGREEISENGKPSFVPTGYRDSKLMNAMTSNYLSTILPSSVTTYSVCPGFCRSSLGRNVAIPFPQKIFAGGVMRLIQRTQLQGAQNVIYTTCESKDDLESGSLYRDGKLMAKEMSYLDTIGGVPEAKKLWDFSLDLLSKH